MYRDFQKNETRNFQNQKEDIEVKNILIDIQQLTKLKDLDIKKFSDEKGYADLLATKLGRMKTSQLRKFFGEIKAIEKKLVGGENWKNVEIEFYQLKPRLAYAFGRKLIPEEFYHVVRITLSKVDIGTDTEKKDNFKMMVKFLEAIVAYHKFRNKD